MNSRWNETEAAAFAGPLGPRVYSSRLLGGDPALVLHGGGNTSVKLREKNLFGEEETILHIKGSGWDLATIEAAGFSPCRLQPLLRLATLDALSDLRMAAELKACMTDPSAPAPSVEAILHAILPAKFVDHTHADAFIAVCNTPGGADRVREIYGEEVIVIPYVMPGFKLAQEGARLVEAQLTPRTIGLALMNHGLVSFGETARESYERMIQLVTRAEEYLSRHKAWSIAWPAVAVTSPPLRLELAQFRRDLSAVMGAPAIFATQADAQSLAFARRRDLDTLATQGPATPDHVIRTKRVPMIGRDLAAYRAHYEEYFRTAAAKFDQQPVMLDPAPRVVLDPEWGVGVAGRTARDTAIAGEIYRHTMEIILRAHALGGWQALPAADIFAVEYWDLEQAKLRRAGKPPIFTGEVALVTGAASGIGRACVDSLLRRGAAVVGLDLNPAIERMHDRPEFRGIVCDLTAAGAVTDALEEAVRAYGGLDLLVLNAGIFPASSRISDLTLDAWRRVMTVNLDANFVLLRECHPLLKLAPQGGRVVVIGSKNVPAPGPGAAAYSASKAAVNQLARIGALEWG
ncbi:MAG TPA: bifunctional aldolase/short-chain dehydrogenase, partial [Opitutaceae bacterium]|nr:bifunctional aldolase/short-chain dehydrogenase [Opitutaceae bacterium]